MTIEDSHAWRDLAQELIVGQELIDGWKAERERRIKAEHDLIALQAEVDELWPYRKRAEKAEKERDKARAGARLAFGRCREVEAERQKVADELYSIRATDPRPLTPDAITDEMIERGAVANWRGDVAHPDWTFEDISDEDRGWYRDNARAVLTAALTEPPPRPEGAEELGELIGTWTATEDIAPAELPTGSLATLADFLAERGVRVVAEEDPR